MPKVRLQEIDSYKNMDRFEKIKSNKKESDKFEGNKDNIDIYNKRDINEIQNTR